MAIDPNQTIEKMLAQPAEVVGHRGRSVRLKGGKVPVCTSTYNYCQDDVTRNEVARRLAALWNLAIGIPTHVIEQNVANMERQAREISKELR